MKKSAEERAIVREGNRRIAKAIAKADARNAARNPGRIEQFLHDHPAKKGKTK